MHHANFVKHHLHHPTVSSKAWQASKAYMYSHSDATDPLDPLGLLVADGHNQFLSQPNHR